MYAKHFDYLQYATEMLVIIVMTGLTSNPLEQVQLSTSRSCEGRRLLQPSGKVKTSIHVNRFDGIISRHLKTSRFSSGISAPGKTGSSLDAKQTGDFSKPEKRRSRIQWAVFHTPYNL